MSTATHEIVILGGNFAGLSCVHYVMRKIVPMWGGGVKVHITLVSPNTEYFFKVGSPRAIVEPALMTGGRIWKPLSEALAQYGTAVTHVQATATGIAPAERRVTLEAAGSADKSLEPLAYDSLIIATGTTSTSPLWTLHTDQSRTPAALNALHAALPEAKTALVAGGGPVGVETAGEIASRYPKCKVTLLSGDAALLRHAKTGLGERAQQVLKDRFRVEVVHSLRVASSEPPADGGHFGPATVTLSDGSTRSVDLYVDATGGRPNSQFLPPDWLDEGKRVKTRDASFRVRGDGSDAAKGVYAVGDVVSGSANTLIELDAMIPVVCSALGADVAAGGKGEEKSKTGTPIKEKPFKPMKDTILVPIGAESGVGTVMGWKVPSIAVRMGKSKSFLVEMVGPMISGKKW